MNSIGQRVARSRGERPIAGWWCSAGNVHQKLMGLNFCSPGNMACNYQMSTLFANCQFQQKLLNNLWSRKTILLRKYCPHTRIRVQLPFLSASCFSLPSLRNIRIARQSHRMGSNRSPMDLFTSSMIFAQRRDFTILDLIRWSQLAFSNF